MLKVGDIVKIMPTATSQKYGSIHGLGWSYGDNSMGDLIGNIVTILDINNRHGGCVEVEENYYIWLLEDLKFINRKGIDMQEVLNMRYINA